MIAALQKEDGLRNPLHLRIKYHSLVDFALPRGCVCEPAEVDNQQPGKGIEQGSQGC